MLLDAPPLAVGFFTFLCLYRLYLNIHTSKLNLCQSRDLYYVAVKAFLEDKGNLFIFKDSYGHWDIPGGRIQKREFSVPLEGILQRKIREELGASVRYRLGKPIIFMRHERKERGSNVRIFAIGYNMTYLSGKIRLSKRHTKSIWVPIKDFNPNAYFKGGWLKGVKEYLAIRKR